MADMGMLSFQTPEEVALARKSAEDARNMQMSQMGLGQSARYGMLSAGSALGNAIGAATGYVDPNEVRAQKTQQVMSSPDSDLNTSKGMLVKAAELRTIDPRLSMQLLLKGRELEKQEQAAAHLTAKDDLAERRFQEAEKVRIANDAQAKADALEAKIQMAKDKLAQEEREGKRDDARVREIAKMVNMLGYAQLEARKAADAAKNADGMTPAQRGKLAKESRDALASTLNIDNETAETISQIKLVQQHEGGAAATGPIAGRIGNWREKTTDYENQLDGAKGKLTKIAKDLMSESGKIGSMQVQEWQILLNTIAAINTKMGQENINIALNNVIDDLERKRDVHYAKLQQKYGSEESPIEKPVLKVPQKSSQYVQGGKTTTGKPATADKFVTGKQYKDAKGNVATYLGNGQWK